jgi:4-hydroxy-tetrahydrodipicolinate synthase
VFKGSIPAVITPFDENKSIDFDNLNKHIDFLIDEESHGLVSCGTTGESPTLDHDEHKKITEVIIKRSNKKVPVMAGCGSNSTKESIELVKHAQSAGADASLLVSPYYNKPSQEGLFQHFSEIANSVPSFPIYLYNIPGRSAVNINQKTMVMLSKINNIVGVKDATSDLSLPLETKLNCGEEFIQLSGEDATFLSFLISGGEGCISVSANVVPKLCSRIYTNWKEGKIKKAMEINELIYPINKVLFIESSPSPVKYALTLMNKCKNNLRLPLVSISEENKIIIKDVMKSLELIN